MSYSVDTSALMDAWVRYYPPDVFDTLWKRVDAMVEEGRLLAVDEVQRELAKQDDELHKWVTARPTMLVALDESLQHTAAAIINRFPSLTSTVLRAPPTVALNLTIIPAGPALALEASTSISFLPGLPPVW